MRVTVAEQVYAERVEDETVLLELASGHYYGLDPIASRLWELLAETGSPEATAKAALAEYDVSFEQLRDDVDALVEDLIKHHLLIVEDDATTAVG